VSILKRTRARPVSSSATSAFPCALALALAVTATGTASIASAAAPILELTPIANGLVVPTAITGASDGSGRLFIAEKRGTIRIFDGATLSATSFLDIQTPVKDFQEQGLIGLAFHPDYASNGFLYVHYSRETDGDSVIARYTVSASDPDDADEGTAFEILRVDQTSANTNHNGGDIHFGPDDFLYIGLGDDGGSGDPPGNAQNLSTLSGSLLRIDVDNPDPGLAYGIPASNPFFASMTARGEIWAYGLRNPWRFSFDRQDGDLFIADVGQGAREEWNHQLASSTGGENYGWNCKEGTLDYPSSLPCNTPPYVPPTVEYAHLPGNCGSGSGSITGGYRYRGTLFHRLSGLYIYADYCTGRIYQATETAPGVWSAATSVPSLSSITTFGEDDDGEIYLATGSGSLYVVPEPNSTASGFAALATLVLAARATRTASARGFRKAP
jgi:glucose/arabinose dehydrogenase